MTIDRIKKLRDKIAVVDQKKAALNARVRKAEAAERKRLRKEEDARKYEAGAIALAVMEEEPDSDIARQLKRRLNGNVPNYRRHLFAQYGIAPEPPTGSNAELRSFKSGKKTTAANDGEASSISLKPKFKS